MNLTAAMTHTAQDIIAGECEQKKYAYRINVTQALSKMKDSMSQFKSLKVPLSGHFRGSLSIDQPKKFLALARP
jgi:hypothetical protein